MASARGYQAHLGIDADVLVAYLDEAHPSHGETKWLAGRAVVLSPTVVHEAYHTLVFKAKWTPEDASRALLDACSDPRNAFINQTFRTAKAGLELAVRHRLGGRDALILASLLGAGVREFVTFDGSLIGLGRVRFGRSSLAIKPA